MVKYTACFVGCELGAIGEHTWLNVDIEAENIEEAEAKLYETHEHIIRLFWLWPGKQTVCEHKANALARTQKGQTHYVSTYHLNSEYGGWRQTDCKLHEVEKVKAMHLKDLGMTP